MELHKNCFFFESVESLIFSSTLQVKFFAEYFFAETMLGCEKLFFFTKNVGISCCCIQQGSLTLIEFYCVVL